MFENVKNVLIVDILKNSCKPSLKWNIMIHSPPHFASPIYMAYKYLHINMNEQMFDFLLDFRNTKSSTHTHGRNK